MDFRITQRPLRLHTWRFLLIARQLVFIFFFFQAEDGIRDVAVTGVQTCALPIFDSSKRSGSMPAEPPRVALRPNLPAVEQSVRSRSDAPSLWKKRRSIELYWTIPMVPA